MLLPPRSQEAEAGGSQDQSQPGLTQNKNTDVSPANRQAGSQGLTAWNLSSGILSMWDLKKTVCNFFLTTVKLIHFEMTWDTVSSIKRSLRFEKTKTKMF